MGYPEGIGVVDLMIGFPMKDHHKVYDYLMKGIKDSESASLAMPAGYMFKEVPNDAEEGIDPIEVTIGEMDKCGVEKGLVGLGKQSIEASRRYPGRFYYSLEVDPNDVMETVRKVRTAKDEHDLTAVTFFPSGCLPQV